MITRRAFIIGSLLASTSSCRQSKRTTPSLVNGHIDANGDHSLSTFDANGEEHARVALPGQAHGFAVSPNARNVVSFPSLPGTVAPVLNFDGQEVGRLLAAPERHFNGHGAYSSDGRLILASQNKAETAEGIIGVYNAQNYRQIKELSAYGIGPHDIQLAPDGTTLIIASGGLQTHPDTGRLELNIQTMRSSLNLINIHTGKLVSSHTLPVDKLSIRHLDVSQSGAILISCQYKGNTELPSLVGLLRKGQPLQMLNIDGDSLWQMKQYTASARFINENLAAVSCPRGNLLSFWDLQAGEYLYGVAIDDVGGIEVLPDQKTVMASANTGELVSVDVLSGHISPVGHSWSGAKWTNHMKKLT